MPTTKDTVSDKDVEKATKRVTDLREKIDAEKVALQQSEASRHNAVVVEQLTVEGDRLEAELAALKEQRKVSEAPIKEDTVVQQLSATQEAIVAEELAADKATKES